MSTKPDQVQSESLYEVAALFLAALWGLIIAKKDEAKITLGDHPELVMFIVSSLLLMASIVWHMLFLSEISQAFHTAALTFKPPERPRIPDVFRPMYDHLFVFQTRCLILGFLASLVTLLSAHLLKSD